MMMSSSNFFLLAILFLVHFQEIISEDVMNETQKAEFEKLQEDIAKNKTLTKGQATDALRRFMASLGRDSQNRRKMVLAEDLGTPEQKEAMHKQVFDQMTKGMSEKAKEKMVEIFEINDNQNITNDQNHEQIKKVIDGAEQDVRAELDKIIDKFI